MKTPPDEIKLAEMLAAANAKGLKGCAGAEFRNENCDNLYPTGDPNKNVPPGATQCCAIGAMIVAGMAPPVGDSYLAVYAGNDRQFWRGCADQKLDALESLGWAFRQAMLPEGE